MRICLTIDAPHLDADGVFAVDMSKASVREAVVAAYQDAIDRAFPVGHDNKVLAVSAMPEVGETDRCA